MLKLSKITKDYHVADTTVHALKGVDLTFRKNEFVSILGPSGCGKTTMLNIIGGLDHYTDGELFINGVSTKSYTDRDWDNYRNHSIGFVFQSYNLIPHQTISENVELALSISGVDKAERIRRAHEALDKVGLKGQYNKKPNQLSGGQCQRVAIARAIVNEPEILLADEPTGALDTVTSVQIMDIIKEIASERLVIMVTHNPELAEQYSTRIINLLDGEVVHDSAPYDGNDDNEPQNAQIDTPIVTEEQTEEKQLQQDTAAKKAKKEKKAKLSAWGAFKLSARNLWSKLKRTILVCIAGSIGIVGVATVLGVSSGVKGYIAGMQDDMLSGNPVTISTENINLDAMMSAMDNVMKSDATKQAVEKGKINVDLMVKYLVERGNDMSSMLVHNDITEDYISFLDSMPTEYYQALVKYYGIELSNNLYTDFNLIGGTKKMSLTAANKMYGDMLQQMEEYKQYAAYITMFTESFRQAPNNEDFILSQYDILSDPSTSRVATKSNEIMIVLNKDDALTDLLLAQFGFLSQDEFFDIVDEAVDPNDHTEHRIPYDRLLNKTFTWYSNNDVFEQGKLPQIPFTYNAYAGDDWTDGKELTVTAILKPKQNVSYGCLSQGIYYTQSFLQEVLADSIESDIVKYLDEKQSSGFSTMVIDGVPSFNEGSAAITFSYDFKMRDASSPDGIKEYNNRLGMLGSVSQMQMLGSMMGGSMSTMTYSLSKRALGGESIPERVAIYPISFKDKDLVTDYLKQWNSDKEVTFTVKEIDGAGNVVSSQKTLTKEQRNEIIYTDTLSLVISMINQFIDIITTALIAFTALSLVVSTVMIAIITYVSVIERIKEIGVIRSLGGRKRDVSNLFIAETFIIGGVSGVIGILLTYGISLILNLILGTLFGIYTIASLPIWQALIMICVSIVLTLISGLVPASLAAKKDPVESLRTE